VRAESDENLTARVSATAKITNGGSGIQDPAFTNVSCASMPAGRRPLRT
jgi:hypothetical protein